MEKESAACWKMPPVNHRIYASSRHWFKKKKEYLMENELIWLLSRSMCAYMMPYSIWFIANTMNWNAHFCKMGVIVGTIKWDVHTYTHTKTEWDNAWNEQSKCNLLKQWRLAYSINGKLAATFPVSSVYLGCFFYIRQKNSTMVTGEWFCNNFEWLPDSGTYTQKNIGAQIYFAYA